MTMTEQELQIAVCEEMGWRWVRVTSRSFADPTKTVPAGLRWRSPLGHDVRRLPYLTLDLCHEAEKTFTDNEDTVYDNLLHKACGSVKSSIRSTAIQRATAFIAVKRKGEV